MAELREKKFPRRSPLSLLQPPIRYEPRRHTNHERVQCCSNDKGERRGNFFSLKARDVQTPATWQNKETRKTRHSVRGCCSVGIWHALWESDFYPFLRLVYGFLCTLKKGRNHSPRARAICQRNNILEPSVLFLRIF
jgi:hypothetical protein